MSCGSGCGCEICGNPPCSGAGGAALCAVAPSTAQAGAAGAVGVSAEASPCDHAHAFPVAIPVTATGITNLLGAAVTFAHSDHVHRIELEVEQAGVLVGSRPRVNFSNAAGNVVFSVTDVPGSDEVTVTGNVAGAAVYNAWAQAIVTGSSWGIGSASWTNIQGMSITIPGSTNNKQFQLCFNADTDADANNTFELRLTKNGVAIAGTVRTCFAGVAHAEWWPATIHIFEQCDVGDVIRAQVRRTAGAGLITFLERVINAHVLDH